MLTNDDENLRALMASAGIDEGQARARLALRYRISAAEGCEALGADVDALLSRTLSPVSEGRPDVEIFLGCPGTSDCRTGIWFSFDGETAHMTTSDPETYAVKAMPGLLRKIFACYLTGYAIARLFAQEYGEGEPASADQLRISMSDLGCERLDWEKPLDMSGSILVGAGGVGNGFAWGASELDLHGSLLVLDPKKVSPGNLNRCLLFSDADLGKPKAKLLASRMSNDRLHVTGAEEDLHTARGGLPKQRVERVIVTVDSRRARRSIQSELPFAVLDASTTGISEIVIHQHSFPTNDACLSCIYPHIPDENARDQSVADGLGLTIEEVRRDFIDSSMAEKIAQTFPGQTVESLIGVSVTSFYKSACGEGVLKTAAGQQATAPLAFVSNLAGLLLCLELLRVDQADAHTTASNYMFVSPWHAPFPQLRMQKPRRVGCEHCGDEDMLAVQGEIWHDRL
jgi:molybdopterin/thiamine biosynthesis adenylyltransferase